MRLVLAAEFFLPLARDPSRVQQRVIMVSRILVVPRSTTTANSPLSSCQVEDISGDADLSAFAMELFTAAFSGARATGCMHRVLVSRLSSLSLFAAVSCDFEASVGHGTGLPMSSACDGAVLRIARRDSRMRPIAAATSHGKHGRRAPS